MSERTVRWDREHREAKSQRQKRYRQRIRANAVAAYGGKCVDCPSTDIDGLEFDHLNNNGNSHRAEIFGYGHASPGGWNFCRWLRDHNYPKDIGIVLRCTKCHTKNRHPNRVPVDERRGSPGQQNPQEG